MSLKLFFAILTVLIVITAMVSKGKIKSFVDILARAFIDVLLSLVVGFCIGCFTGSGWSPWSEWSSTPVYESDTREVQEKEVLVAYDMAVYVTQEDKSQNHYRNFRDFSIKGEFENYGARDSYGEKHFELQISPEQLDKAATYGPGEHIPSKGDLYVGGYNMSSKTAYVIPIALDSQGRYYPLFIMSEIKEVQYRYRDKN